MSTQMVSVGARSGKGGALGSAKEVLPVQPRISDDFSRADGLLRQKYRELIRKHLSGTLDNLFADFTGLHFHIAWTPSSAKGWDAQTLPTGCSVCCRLSGSRLLPECRTCGPDHLASALESDRGHHFTCRLGVRNYWLPVRVRGETLSIAYLQALEHSIPKSLARPQSSSIGRARLHRTRAIVLSRVKFSRAARFLRLIIEHVQESSLSDLRKAELSSAGRAVVALERERERLHRTLDRQVPSAPPTSQSTLPGSRAEQLVRGMLKRIELDYAKPITLRRVACEAGMNAAYLSDLFSRTVGVPFKTYLTELRLAKAKALFRDSSKTTSEVAFAVGYASEDRFRFAFKKATGLSPKAWRETMQWNTPSGAG